MNNKAIPIYSVTGWGRSCSSCFQREADCLLCSWFCCRKYHYKTQNGKELQFKKAISSVNSCSRNELDQLDFVFRRHHGWSRLVRPSHGATTVVCVVCSKGLGLHPSKPQRKPGAFKLICREQNFQKSVFEKARVATEQKVMQENALRGWEVFVFSKM